MRAPLVWLVGEPGAGKTTLARCLLGEVQSLVLKPKWTIGSDGVIAAGHYEGKPFDGADTISYSGGRAAMYGYLEMFYANPQVKLVLLDGDRLSNRSAVDVVGIYRSPPLRCVLVTCAEAAERRASRGTTQSPAWVKGRATKARRFWETFPSEHRLELYSANNSPAGLAQHIREWVFPITSRLVS